MGEKVHNRIKEYRLKMNLTQDELAKAVGVSRQSINSIERERYIPSLPLALRFANFFDCQIDELFRLQDEDGHAP
jgi:putative transcriptional regulator